MSNLALDNKKDTDKLLQKVGIRKEGLDRDNPFDLVPNLASRNDFNSGSIKRSLQFWAKVKGTSTSRPAESPHTLPFMSLEAYHGFLNLAGDSKSASRVKKYMNCIRIGLIGIMLSLLSNLLGCKEVEVLGARFQ